MIIHQSINSTSAASGNEFALSQQQDPELWKIIQFLTNDLLPDDKTDAKKVVAQAHSFAIVDGVLYFIDVKHNHQKRCVVSKQLRIQLMEENHSGPMAGHFAGEKLYRALTRHWWWPGMYTDVVKYCSNCPQCTIVNGSGRVNKPPLSPIPVQRPFQIVGVDVMDRARQPSCSRISRFFNQVAFSFSSARSKSCTISETADRGGHPPVWGSRGPTF